MSFVWDPSGGDCETCAAFARKVSITEAAAMKACAKLPHCDDPAETNSPTQSARAGGGFCLVARRKGAARRAHESLH